MFSIKDSEKEVKYNNFFSNWRTFLKIAQSKVWEKKLSNIVKAKIRRCSYPSSQERVFLMTPTSWKLNCFGSLPKMVTYRLNILIGLVGINYHLSSGYCIHLKICFKFWEPPFEFLANVFRFICNFLKFNLKLWCFRIWYPFIALKKNLLHLKK